MTQRPLSARSSISSLSSSSAISLQQVTPVANTNPAHSFATQQSTNPTSGHPSQPSIGVNGNLPSASPTNVVQAANPPAQARPSQQSASGSTASTVTSAPSSSSSNSPTPAITPTPTSVVQSKKTPTRFARYFDNWWAWEISAGLLAIICLATIIVVLAVFDNKPQPEMRWGITLNALIALITTVMKGASLTPLMEGMSQLKWLVFARETRPLMDFNVYDGASRGGLNALTLFWHMRKRFWREATALAALFYFLSFGVDTFVQQLIQTEYQDDVVPTSSAVTLQRAQRYDGYAQVASSQGSILPDGPDADMIAAIYTPLYATKTTDQSDLFNCPESNCTYPDTPSLAVCGERHDLSSAVVTTTWAGGDIFSLAGGPELSGTVTMNVTATMEPARTISFTDRVALIASFAYVNSSFYSTYYKENHTYVNPTHLAGECALFPCVQEYRTEVRRGVLNQTVIREWTYVAPRRITNSTSEATGQWDYWADINVPTPGLEGPSASIDFNMSIQALLGMQMTIPRLLNGSVVTGTSGGPDYGALADSLIMSRIYATTDMAEFIKRIAASLTSSIRRHPTREGMPDYLNPYDPVPSVEMPDFSGQALRQLPFAKIQWPWIVLPALTVLFSNVFLIFAMIRTKQAQRNIDVGVWKSSCLPVLYHGLDMNAFARANIDPALSTSVAYMEENAGQLRVRLNAAGSDIKLS